ncbi:family 43 glycosylhydrolase [Paenibacillus sp. B-A-8]|uniref:family 43 glycosylhydrolase n=1 Tax=Paenibacillus sp. B-A-8 TaxID=3400419 RepID=UPI003B02CC6F
MYKKCWVLVLVCSFFICFLPGKSIYAADQTAKNPIIWADIPDVSVIRVEDTFYMTSTTMHMNPGVPVMKSKDLVNWEIVSYVYDILADNDKQTLTNGQNIYGQGSWASNIRYHNGKFYVVFASNDIGKTFVFQTTNIEKGPWEKYELAGGVYHDMSLLFDDDGRVYLVHGNGTIRAIELTSDATAIKPGGMNKVIIQNASAPGGTGGLGAEGSHIYKINGKYYIFNISWPTGGIRTQLVHRADQIDGPYEGKVALKSGSNTSGAGVAQGGIVQAADGKWYGMLFQDYGSVGRIPYIVPMTWSEDNWPVFGDVNDTGIAAELSKSWVASDNFDQRTERVSAYHTEVAGGENDDNGSNLAYVWQWNHNPDNRYWSLTDRPGHLRLTTGRTSTSILDARNTLTQRTFGPESSGTIAIDVSHMKDGDVAGISSFQKIYGYVGVKMSGSEKSIVMVNGSSGSALETASIPINQDVVYLRTELDYKNRTDKASFYYSLDGKRWASIGNTLQMSYTLPHFMGYRFALFNYATKTAGGYVDFDYFKIGDKLEGTNVDTNLKELRLNGVPLRGFSPNIYSYDIDVPEGAAPPQVTAMANDPEAMVKITQTMEIPGIATVKVIRDGIEAAVYTLRFSTPVFIAIEAETAADNSKEAYVHGTINGHTWSLVDGQSTKAMFFGPDTGFNMPGTDAATLASGSRLGYKINIPKAGAYQLWILAKSVDFNSDSVHVGVDQQYKFTSNGIEGISGGQFKWVNLSNGGSVVPGGEPLNMSAGEHELNFWGREDGLTIDRIYLTTSTSTADPVWPSTEEPEPLEPAVALSATDSVKPGSSFTVGVKLNNLVESVYAQDITFTYDANVFEYMSATSATYNVELMAEDKDTLGEVRLIAANIGGISGASTPSLDLTFKVKSGVQNTSGTIAVKRAELGTSEGAVIQAKLDHKVISVGSIDVSVDKTALNAAITNGQSLYDAAVVGTLPGQYPQAAKDAFGIAINAAKAVKDNSGATQSQVDNAVTDLLRAVNSFKSAVIKEVSADLNNDGIVNVGDLAIVAYHYGKDSASSDWAKAKIADLNGDQKIDITDLAFVATKILN